MYHKRKTKPKKKWSEKEGTYCSIPSHILQRNCMTSMSESDFLHGEIFFGYFLNASNHLHPWVATTIVMIFLWSVILYIMFYFESSAFESEEDDGDGD